jgi:lipopolysaccharide/colanic/teichoic acid biosynthesis glycosyltransferase
LEEPCVLGPAVLWDKPALRPPPGRLDWSQIEPARQLTTVSPHAQGWTRRGGRGAALYQAGKRAFDLAFSLVVLTLVMPAFPLVMLAIWLEDGRPFFFGHRRETRGGRVFPCLKFRSMRKNAEQIKGQLQKENQADGPQFYIAQDPRLTRVGRFIRKLNIDELPQFINVLLGHMSVVGPRPSPRQENQFCPDWRKARLSVRPGVTGLWQVKRTRRQGFDFQEWIRFDLEYVERAGWGLDLYIIWRTVWMIVRGAV